MTYRITPINTDTELPEFTDIRSNPTPSSSHTQTTVIETLDIDEINTSRPGPTASDGTQFYLQDDGTLVNIEGIIYEEYTKERNEQIDAMVEEMKIEELRQIYVNSTGDFALTLDNQTYNLSNDDRLLLESVIASEAINDYDDALAVVSVILNRCDEGNWGGSDPISVITAKGQFAAYFDGYYQKYYNGDVEIPDAISQAVEDGLNGIRNNNFLEFRSSSSTTFTYQVSEGGNKYGHRM